MFQFSRAIHCLKAELKHRTSFIKVLHIATGQVSSSADLFVFAEGPVLRPYHLLFESVLVELLERKQPLSWQQADESNSRVWDLGMELSSMKRHEHSSSEIQVSRSGSRYASYLPLELFMFLLLKALVAITQQ